MEPKTREPQYEVCLEVRRRIGQARLGLMSNQTWHDYPRRLAFMLCRYKFVSKMMSGLSRVLEVGCADAFGTRVVQQEVKHVTAVDFDPVFIADVKERMDASWPVDCRVHDMLEGPVTDPGGPFDGAYALDVLEHIDPKLEGKFLGHMVASLTPAGIVILGMPSIHSQAYASPASKAGHVNCKDLAGLKAALSPFFHHVFVFSMNDEVVHTGFAPMAHYLLAMGCHRK